MPISVDIVLPCYNPNENWPSELLMANDFINQAYSANYIIVNDGSVSGTILTQIDFLKQKGMSLDFLSYETNKGKGFALRKGMEVSKADYVIYTDIDFPFTNQSLLTLLNKLTANEADVAVGYRDESYYDKKMSGFRKILSKAFRFFVKQILKMPVTDTQCGLKGFNKKGKDKFLRTTIDRYLFDFEFIYTACKDQSLSILPVQVQLKENVQFSRMKLKIIIQELVNLTRILFFKKN